MTAKEEREEQEEATDLARMWQEALLEYYTNAQIPYSKMQVYSNMNDIMQDKDIQQKFEKYRHNKGKVDKLRTLISKNSDMIITGAGYVAQAASAAFPPSAAIVTALTYMMKISKDVSRDYDIIVDFFEKMNTFLVRLSIIEKNVPAFTGFKSHLMKVLTCLLSMCGFATKAIREDRWKKAWNVMRHGGGDEELAAADSAVDQALRNLDAATGFANLANTTETKGIVKRIDANVNEVKSGIANVTMAVDNIQSGVGNIAVLVDGVNATTTMIDSRTARMEEQALKFYLQMSAKFDKLLVDKQRRSDGQTALEPQTGSPAFIKNQSFERVMRTFPVKVDPTVQDRDIEYTMVTGTAMWLFDEPVYKSWSQGTSSERLLWLSGDAGLGKTGLAYRAIRDLQRSTASDSKVSVAYFYFRNDHVDRSSVKNALFSLLVQLAKLDSSFCDALAEASVGDGDILDMLPMRYFWLMLIATLGRCQGSSIFLILDGLDEVNRDEIGVLLKCLNDVNTMRTNIRVMLTSRPDFKNVSERLQNVQTIMVTRDMIAPDMRLVVQARLKSLSRLHKHRNQVKRLMVIKILEKADSMLYIEHMLQQLNRVGSRETLVLKALENIPENLQSLYFVMITEIQNRRTPDQLQTLGRLFTWFAFSKRPLRLDESNDVARLFGQDPTFRMEEEIANRSGRILELVGVLADDEQQDEGYKEGDFENDGVQSILAVTDDDGSSAVLRFQDRSLRDYCREIDTAQPELRASPNAGNLAMLEMCVHMLCGICKDESKAIEPGLVQYATMYWTQHMHEIDIRTASDDDVNRVADCFRLIFSNHNDVCKIFEEREEFTYSKVFGPSEKRLKRTWNTLANWIQRAAALGEGKIGELSYRWVEEVTANRSRIMIGLAQGHVRNWLRSEFQGLDNSDEMKPFRLATEALRMANLSRADQKLLCISKPVRKAEISGLEDEDDVDIQKVAEYFPDIAKDATAHRAIAMALARSDKLDAAKDECEIALEKSTTDIDRFRSQILMALLYLAIAEQVEEQEEDGAEPGDHEDLSTPKDSKIYLSYEMLSEALKNRPADDSKSTVNFVRKALCICADTQRKLGMDDEAMNTIQSARVINPEEILEAQCLDMIPRALKKTSRYAEIIEHLRGWTFWERMTWLTWEAFSYGDKTNPHNLLQEAAMRSNNGIVLVEIYEEIIKYLDQRKSSASTRQALAHWFYEVNQDYVSAKELYYKILNSDSCIDPSSGEDDFLVLHYARLQLSDIIYREFTSASDPRQKAKLLDERRKLQEPKTGENITEVERNGSFLAINLARMVLKMASALEYEEILNQSFSACIDALADDIGLNDAGYLVLLARVLACVKGLERDAQIAFSARFSIIDPNVNHDIDALDSSSSEISDDVQSDGSDVGGELEDGLENEPEDEPEDESENEPENDAETSTDATRDKEKSFDDSLETVKPNAILTRKPTLKSNRVGTGLNIGQTVNKSKIVSEDWGDTIPTDTLIQCCDGMGEKFEGWTNGPIYLCLICTDCSLCEKCYTKVQHRNKDGTWDHWHSFCGQNHNYIKGPIEGWKGVTDGYMTIGAETTKFSDWLSDLKEKRWGKAWEMFWRSEIGVYDIL